ncbi:protein kinase domain-containing protein [Paenibacillus alvei]|uniref:protein kinase domain-containing protein n=1 Tax=Paenibacillus alvei TaxID=44250 RepID=UPI0013D99631|nr:protein kinase [Paenibacillus alvei]
MKPDYADICLKRNFVLHQSYKVKKVIACSELDIVYAGQKLEDETAVIVKEFYPRQVALRDLDKRTVLCRVPSVQRQYDGLQEAFLTETQILQKLSHPNIVSLVDHFQENGTHYMIMEYCKGISLERFIEEGRLVSVADFLRDTILPLASALEYVHGRGIIHRDIKPANIIIGEDGQPKLLDFGSAVYYEKTGHRIFTSTGYSPLEFYSEKSRQGVTSDIYSFAATMYFCLSGRTPNDVTRRLFQDNLESVRSLNRNVSPLMARTIRKGLAVRSDKRYASMKQMKAELHAERILLSIVDRLLGKHKPRQQEDRKQA